MEPTHFLYLAHPPRPSFFFDKTPDEDAILARHFAWLGQLLAEGKLLLAGPCLDGVYGVTILELTDLLVAEETVKNDPAVREGLFKSELHPLHIGMMA
jgi:uncharacterized protein YciI